MNKIKSLCLIPVAGLLILTACQSTPQMTNRPNFLSTYDHLQEVDKTTLRYVSPVLLAQCNRFSISPVQVPINEVQGKPTTAEQRQRTADFVRQTVANALSDRYPIVNEKGPDVGEIRIALTEAYRTGGRLGLCVQGEVLDNSGTQVAAVVKTELSELYVADWENRDSAKKMVSTWAERMRKTVDDAHSK